MARRAEIRMVEIRISGDDEAHAERTMEYVADVLNHIENVSYLNDTIDRSWELDEQEAT